jgi:dephospho-CoA kinase
VKSVFDSIERMANKPTIGLTGGIASGKSTVSRLFEQLGVAVVDADQLAREVVAIGSDGLREVVEAFGPQVLATDGNLDREKLGAIVFSDEQARRKLQAITHPRIARLGAERIATLQTTHTPYVIYDAPLLVEVGAHGAFAALIVVAASVPTQIARLHARDGLNERQSGERLASQLPLARKIAVADYVIHNDGSIEELAQRTREVHAQILERFALDGSRA